MTLDLGPLEMRVLGLFGAGEARSVADVQGLLGAQGYEAAYTTVMTVLSRLHEKRLLVREKDGRRYVYRAAPRSSRVKHSLLQRVRRSLFSDRLAPIAALLDEDLDRSELHELRRMIDKKLKGST
jgi:predicted transcriptional regulator